MLFTLTIFYSKQIDRETQDPNLYEMDFIYFEYSIIFHNSMKKMKGDFKNHPW